MLRAFVFLLVVAISWCLKVQELHDFGKVAATGLCKLPGLAPIVSFPKWGDAMMPDQPKMALAYVRDGKVHPFLGVESIDAVANGDPKKQVVSAQALFCPPDDVKDRLLYVLDSGHGPKETELHEGAAKLLKIEVNEDGTGGKIKKTYTFDKDVVPNGSFLNDVRIGKSFAYITDSNRGAIVILDLFNGEAAVWKDDRSMQPQLDDGEDFLIGSKNLSSFMVSVDGIAYSSHDDMLYFKPVTRSHLYRINAGIVRVAFKDKMLHMIGDAVEDMGVVGFHDGLDADSRGHVYLTDLSKGAIQRRGVDGRMSHITDLNSMSWPDCVIAAEGSLYVLTTQVHLMPFMNNGEDLRKGGNKLVSVKLPAHDEL